MKVKKTVSKHLALGPDRLGEVTEKHSQKQDVASPRWPLLKSMSILHPNRFDLLHSTCQVLSKVLDRFQACSQQTWCMGLLLQMLNGRAKNVFEAVPHGQFKNHSSDRLKRSQSQDLSLGYSVLHYLTTSPPSLQS